MKILLISGLSLGLLLSATVVNANNNNRVAEQAKLDAACQAARERKLTPERKQHIEECVHDKKTSREECEQFYHDYGERDGNRPAFYYDLPECVQAFDYEQSYRR